MAPADEMLLEQNPARVVPLRPAVPRPRKLVTADPEMNRQERLIFNAYLLMIVMVVAFLAVVGLVALP